MKTLIITALIGLTAITAAPTAEAGHGYARSDSIWIGSFRPDYRWRPVNRKTLVVWSAANRPYLVKLGFPVHDMRFARHLGLSRTGGRVTKFDSVIVDGYRVPIRSIRAIKKSQARELRWQPAKVRAKYRNHHEYQHPYKERKRYRRYKYDNDYYD